MIKKFINGYNYKIRGHYDPTLGRAGDHPGHLDDLLGQHKRESEEM